jgi:hypothetical protein
MIKENLHNHEMRKYEREEGCEDQHDWFMHLQN